MARPKKLKPGYCRESSSCAFVTIDGKRRYLAE